jgi:hypothetical protein
MVEEWVIFGSLVKASDFVKPVEGGSTSSG